VRWPFALVCVATSAAADPQLAPITDRNYAIDLYNGVPFGNSATIAVGGAAAANAIGSSGTLINPSASAVRPTTDLDAWSWDYHLDYLNGSLSSDYTNSGLTAMSTGSSALTGGLALRRHDLGFAVTATAQTLRVGTIDTPAPNTALDASTIFAKIAFAKWQPQLDTAFGLALTIAQFDLSPDCSGCSSVFTISGGGLEAGAQWIPGQEDLRLGLAIATPIVGGNVVAQGCTDLSNCDGFILPDRVVSAWRFTGGAAYRFADSAWNQQVAGTFRDERAVTVTADLVVTGPSSNAFGLEAFAQHQLERSGSHASWSPRAGVEYDWLPGRLRVRGGSYWEPGRFDGVAGRLHGTFGLEVRVFEFRLWGLRRGKITLTGDLATRYQNGGLSVGFWH
jgi:hypothetical protein